jgi:capsule polysaccharide modification protein KpsS
VSEREGVVNCTDDRLRKQTHAGYKSQFTGGDAVFYPVACVATKEDCVEF